MQAAPGAWAYLRSLLPQGSTLPAATWASRHRVLGWTLVLHSFVLAFYGFTRGWTWTYALGEPAALVALVAASRWPALPRRVQGALATLALVGSSWVFVQFSHGATAAHAHYLVALAFASLYHDWSALLLALGAVAVGNGVGGALRPDWVYADRPEAPWQMALIETIVAATEAVALLSFWSGYEAARARGDLVLDSAGEGIVGLDSSGTVTFANPAACALFGRRDVTGLGIRELMAGTGFTPGPGAALAGQGTLATRSGATAIEWTVTPTLRSGVAIGSVMVVRDVSGRRRLEQELDLHRADLEALVQRRTAQLTEANRELEAFSYTVSHDLRSPLRAIGGFSAILERRHGRELPEDSREMLRLLREGAGRMGDLIESVLLLTRIGRTQLADEDVDLSQLARELVDELAAKTPARSVRVHIEPGLACRGDKGLLRLALGNLLNNAWKFTANTAKPAIRVLHGPLPGSVIVEDNGAGFDMALAQGLFEPFHRLHQANEFEGTGVGLATVRRVIQRHGGTITAQAWPGSGARFTFTLPVPGAPAALPPTPVLEPPSTIRVVGRPRRTRTTLAAPDAADAGPGRGGPAGPRKPE